VESPDLNKAKKDAAYSPSKGKVIVIVSLFVAISFLLAGLIYIQGNVFDGVRAYVRGEGLWAKAQKDAVYYLTRYTYSYDDTDYRNYLNAIKVNLGDKSARIALQQATPNLEQAHQGFLLGNNDPNDIDAMIWFFLNFKSIKYMSDAIAIWEKADQKIEELRQIGTAVRNEVIHDGNRKQEMVELRQHLQDMDIQLLDLENRFSIVLGIGARWVKNTTWIASIIILLSFVGVAVFISTQIIRGIARSEKELIESETRFRSLKESNTIGILSWHMDGSISDANTIFYNMLGYTDANDCPSQLNWREITPPEFQARDEIAIQELLQYGRCEPFEKAFYHRDGIMVPTLIGASLLSAQSDQGMAFVIDLSERKKAEEQMKLAATVLDASHDGIMITDPDLNIISVNNALCAITGYTEQELLGNSPRLLRSGHETSEHYEMIWQALEDDGHWQGNIVDRHKDGALLPLRISISVVTDDEDRPSHYVALLSDNTQQKAQEDYLRHVASHDHLTGLPNRVLFYDRFKQAINYAKRNNTKFAVLYFDLNNFKPVNDQYGHAFGDKLLQIVARRLKENIRATDTVTRLGGDEFVILLSNVTDRESVNTVLTKTIESVCALCKIDGVVVHPSISVGVAIYPEDGSDENALMHHADLAMYEMKHARSNGAQRLSGN
jgi:diguanylate cyclase (GGDEF)-like protein/PAS domain S-box-containing protein